MAIRSIDELNQDQNDLLDDYRNRLAGGGSGGAASTSSPRPTLQWGRVTQVVASDPDFGPHLVVQGKLYTGSPPALTNASAAPFRCHPAPGKTVNDYATNDYVRLTPTAGAMIAERLA